MWVRTILLTAALVLAPLAARAEIVVRWAPPEPAVSWDPHGADVLYTAFGQGQVYDRLLNLSSGLVLQPGLATSWRLVAPDRWRFELRQGVHFHDGAPLATEDVVFSLERARAQASEIRNYLSSIAEVRMDGPAIEVRTRGPDLLLPIRIRRVGIMSARWAREHGAAEATPYYKDADSYARDHAMGTGPFRLEAAQTGGSAVLVRNPDWWDLKQWPHPIDKIVWTPISDGHERAVALLRDEVDFAQDLPPDEVGSIRAAPGVRLTEVNEMRVHYLGFNQGLDELPGSDVKGRNPFRDRRVREAVYYAIDIDGLIERAEAGLAVSAGMLAAPGINGWSEELNQRLPHDPGRAKALLTEAGYPDGFTVPLLCQPSLEPACRGVAEQLARVGIRAKPDVHPPDEFFALQDAEIAGFWLVFVNNSVFDSQFIFRQYYHTGGWVESKGYANPRLDTQIDAIDSELSSPVRDALIEQVWQQVLADSLVVPLYRRKYLAGTRDWLEVPISPQSFPYFREARLTGSGPR